jgi:polysaccharide biosynthesis protein PslJ
VSIVTDRRAGTALSAGAGSTGSRDRGAPVRIIQIYAVLLVLIPPTHIIGPLGAMGTPATVLGVVALMLWGVAVLTPGDYLCRTAVPVRVVMGLLVGTTLLGYAVLHLRHIPGAELLGSDRALLKVLSWAGVALLAAEGLRDRGELYRVLRTLSAAVAVMAVVGLLQFRSGIDLAELVNRIPGLQENAELVSIQDRAGFRRPAGTATHPIEFGCVIAMAFPLALHLARFDVARSPVRRWLPVGAVAVGIPVAVSRSAVLGAVVAAVVIFLGLEPRLRPRALAAAAAFIVVIYATTPGLLGTLRDLFVNAGSDSSITYRTNDYEAVGEYIRQAPWLGRGPGTFLADNYIILDNQYLLSAIEIGLVGLIVVIGYLIATAFLGRGTRHRTKDPAIRDLGQALAATSLASAVAAFTFDGFVFLMFAGFIPLCLGVAGALWTMERAAERPIGVERPLEVERWDPPREAPPVGVLDEPAADRRAEDATPRAADVTDLAGAALAYRSDDAGQAGHEQHRADEEFEWLTPSVEEPFVITARSSSGQPRRVRTGDDRHDTHDLRRVVALIGAGVALAVLAALPFTIDRDRNDPDLAVTRIPPRTPSMPVITSTTTSTATSARPSDTTSTVPRIIATAQPPPATPVRPLRSDDTTAASSNRRSAQSPSSSPTSPPVSGPTGTTTPATVPPTTTTTTTPTTTTTTPTTTTTTTPTTTTTTTTIPTSP